MIDLADAPGGTNNFQKVIFCQNIYCDLSVAQPYSLRSSASHHQIHAKQTTTLPRAFLCYSIL